MVAPLTELKIKRAKPKDKLYNLFDGNGLYLEVKPNDKKTQTRIVKLVKRIYFNPFKKELILKSDNK